MVFLSENCVLPEEKAAHKVGTEEPSDEFGLRQALLEPQPVASLDRWIPAQVQRPG